MTQILLVAPDDAQRRHVYANLERNGFSVATSDGIDDVKAVDVGAIDIVVSRDHLHGSADLEILNVVGDRPVIVIADHGSIPAAVAAIKHGATDYLCRPFEPDELIAAVERAARPRDRRRLTAVERTPDAWPMIGRCAAMQDLFSRIAKVAPTESSVLIQGETGTGKELVARAVHAASNRRNAPMITLNCAAIPETLLEAELFGHEQDSFVSEARRGLVEAADAGTLFLDDVGELTLEAQARLLRVLERGEIRKVGASNSQHVDVRVIAASHRNLRQLTEKGQFREDLYYRLNVVTLTVPPLRERGDDILELAASMLKRTSQKLAKPNVSLASEAAAAICHYHWPGNVRELENAIEHAVILSEGNVIEANLLAIDVIRTVAQEPIDGGQGNVSLEDYFVRVVTENQDQLTETELAQRLGISRKSLWERRQRLNIPRRRTRKRGPRRDG